MTKTVEKYRKHSYATMDPNQSAKDLQVHIPSLSLSIYIYIYLYIYIYNYQKTELKLVKLSVS